MERTIEAKKRIILGVTGASGAVYGVRLLELLRDAGVETHLVVSAWGRKTLLLETERKYEDLAALADHCYEPDMMSATIASGSFACAGMIVAPCSMKTLSAISNGFAYDLISRAADVTLKERRRLLLLARETPLSVIHLENMLRLSQAGAIVMPPTPAFYTKPSSLDQIVDQTALRAMDIMGLTVENPYCWQNNEE